MAGSTSTVTEVPVNWRLIVSSKVKLVVLAGRIRSGKTYVARSLEATHGFVRFGFGDYVREQASQRGLGLDRSSLQELGQLMVETDAEQFTNGFIEHLPNTPTARVVVDGLRHKSVMTALSRALGGDSLIVAGVKVPLSVQLSRLREQYPDTDDQVITRWVNHPNEAQIDAIVNNHAAIILSGTEAAEMSCAKVLHLWSD